MNPKGFVLAARTTSKMSMSISVRRTFISLTSAMFTARKVMKPILDRAAESRGITYHLAYSPEREDPGRKDHSTRTIPKLVGGIDDEAGQRAAALYASALESVIPVRSAEVAEAAKILENVYRAVNIALVNELKVILTAMGVDVWVVIEAASTKPFGFQAFYPGPGLGGHCIPIDPFYLTWKARQYDFSTRFIELAGEINTNMPYDVVDGLMHALNDRSKALRGAKILVLGVAYKKNVDDLRESPSLKIIDILLKKGADVSYNDPHIPVMKKSRHFPNMPEFKSVELTPESLGAADAVFILTDHDRYDQDFITEHADLVVDTRNATKAVQAKRSNIVKL